MLRCELSKEEILEILADEFTKVTKDLDSIDRNNRLWERNQGRYVALMDLLQRIPIFEEQEGK